MILEENYKEEIRLKKNNCAVNIMKCYMDILYGEKRKKIFTIKEKKQNKNMLDTVVKEIDELIGEII